MQHDLTKAKIIELVPEIVELKFGCLVRNSATKPEYDKDNLYIETLGKQMRVFQPTFGLMALFPQKNMEILGRPITLADVLRAIGKAYKPECDSFSIIVSTKGVIEEMDCGGGYETWIGLRSCEWELDKDYDGQTQEVKEFIGKLLGV